MNPLDFKQAARLFPGHSVWRYLVEQAGPLTLPTPVSAQSLAVPTLTLVLTLVAVVPVGQLAPTL